MASYLLRSLVDPILPWDVDEAESNRYRNILVILLVFSIILSIIIPMIEVEKPDRNKRTSIPPRLVKMVLEQKKKEVKPPPPPVEEPKKEEEKPKEEKKEEKPKEEPKPEKKNAKEVAKKHIAVFDALADLRDQDDMDELKKQKSLSNDQGEAAKVTRSLIVNKNVTKGSGGIQVATASQSSGTGALAGQNTTNVKSDIGDAVANLKRTDRSGNATRSSENIQLAFDKHGSALDRLYQRALRKNPTLAGTVKLKLVIQPNGAVSSCSVADSEIDDPELLKRIVSRVKRINFGALNVAVWEGTYPINFLPNQ